ncbi:MAG: YceI family protein [Chloroflexia bacterium]|nr:YceI family protein [Chloroflexia bacterium]
MAEAAVQTRAATYQVDTAHSFVEFSVKHLVVATARGRFTSFDGELTFDPADPSAGSVRVSIDADSVDTRDAKRDEHLRSNDFFGAGDDPQITFASTRIEPRRGDDYNVFGNLTIRGVTKEVLLDTTFNGVAVSPWGQHVASFSATTEISRKDFGVNWNAALEGGGVMVSDNVKISLDIEAIQQ